MTARTFLLRRHVVAAAAGVALGLASLGASAQAFPDKPVTLVVPFPPGGTTDIIARGVAEGMARELKQSVVVENRAGAGGNVGAESVVRAKPDGYTLFVSTAGPLAINHHLYTKQNYDPMRDFSPVALLGMVPIMLVTGPQQPFKSVADLITFAKANPGKLSYGSQGNGTTSHLTMELLKSQAGIDMVHVPYRGSAPAATDLMGGQVQVMFDNSPSTLPFVKGDKMRALGVASAERVPAMKDIPAISETIKGFESTAWFALVAPANTPPDVVRTLNAAVNATLKRPEVREKFAASGAELAGGTPDDLAKFMRQESAKWQDVVRAAKVKLD
ncbi:Bug family tripartite tricarboxylate transporter substrate binding protein [Ramlibacter rhizophilus]|uniref:Tripartite tricarboxylate transporter substrate binding protein n=1 Tax=Ramlibacter rhizophilus TaxID=1781167 RepID=A0A4Z0BNL6_9BURK|nr:tripartite tricarboxylate transporter substrate binding protein [Ramlibacter rhizophilus]TFY99847.1 tripartite tricarboxylate transporter substrate binding protein [Ramlibacter rhizophilus]